ncbi:hypothetical protein CLV58_113158 [Spirosoma oryzae]|uniref:Uncharacterized protein n=1 Tax=Spirosoma oryzae TaxID=1469603 RepID=A0A2T0SRJ0_9BACT|nr:hypothetical protein CLV58_113158 [Spirosoma oryzae]
MDRDTLETKLQPFVLACAEKGYQLRAHCLDEAYPGDSSTSYFLRVTADWIDTMDCSGALDVLLDILWDTTDTETRAMIFAIIIHDKNDQLHCYSPPLHSTVAKDETVV